MKRMCTESRYAKDTSGLTSNTVLKSILVYAVCMTFTTHKKTMNLNILVEKFLHYWTSWDIIQDLSQSIFNIQWEVICCAVTRLLQVWQTGVSLKTTQANGGQLRLMPSLFVFSSGIGLFATTICIFAILLKTSFFCLHHVAVTSVFFLKIKASSLLIKFGWDNFFLVTFWSHMTLARALSCGVNNQLSSGGCR